MKFLFATPLPIQAQEGQGAGLSRPPWARPPPLIIRLPEQSRRQPRASKTQSGGIAWDKPRQRGREVRGERARRLCRRAPASPGPSARPAPAAPTRPRPLAVYLHTPRPGLAGPPSVAGSAPAPFRKRLLCAESWTVLSPRLSPNETLRGQRPVLSLSLHTVKRGR